MLDMVKKYKYPLKIAEVMGLTRERVRQILIFFKIPNKKMPWSETNRGIKIIKLSDLKKRKKIEKLNLKIKKRQNRDKKICSIYKKGKYTQKELGQVFNLEQAYINIILGRNGLLYRNRKKWMKK